MATEKSALGSKPKLINATIALLASKGYESTGINEILDNAKVSKSNFYYHFKSKEELCLAALDKIAELFFKTVIRQTLANPDLKPLQRLERHFDYLLEVMETQSCDGGCVFTNLEAETSDFYPAFRERLRSVDRQTADAIEDAIKQGIKNGEFRKDLNTAHTANLILSIYKGVSLLAKAEKSPDIIRESRNTLFKLLAA